MNKEFEIEIKEELSRTITINAESIQEAVKKVKEQYDKEEIILDESDLKAVEIEAMDTAFTNHTNKELAEIVQKVRQKKSKSL